MEMKLKTLASIISMTLLSSTANAANICHQASVIKTINGQTSDYAFDCPSEKGITTFSGGASDYIDEMNKDIETSGEEVSEAIQSGAKSVIKTIQSGNELLIKTMVELSQAEIKDTLTLEKQVLDMKMEFQTEMAENEINVERSVMGLNDTKEEVMFIIDELKTIGDGDADSGYNHMQVVIAAMKSKYDNDPDFLMPQELKASEEKVEDAEGCLPYDPQTHKKGELDIVCFSSIPSKPALKLEKYWNECSRVKRTTLSNIQSNISKKAIRQQQAIVQNNYEEKSKKQSSDLMITAKIKDQSAVSCTTRDLEFSLCFNADGSEMQAETYIDKVINNEIIPNGNISSVNFLNPASVGSVDGDLSDLSETDLNSMKITQQQKRDENGDVIASDVAISGNTPPLVKTYRSSSQYFAAKDFVSNIINREAVNGVKSNSRTNAKTDLLKSKIIHRSAALSLAETSLMKPIESRMGLDLSISIASNELSREGVTDENGKVSILKESLSGASEADRMAFEINKDYDKLSTNATSAITGGGVAALDTASEKQLVKWQIDAMSKANDMLLKEYERNERMELLLATMVAQNANNPLVIKSINNMKVK